MFAAVMIRFNLGRTFCAGAVAKGWRGGDGREKYLASFRSAIVFRGTRCMHTLQKMHIDSGNCKSLAHEFVGAL